MRNRAWILPQYLGALERLDYPPERLRFAFVINDCTDTTADLLSAFATKRPTRLLHHDLHHPAWRRGWYSYHNLALLRNLLLEELLAGQERYLLAVDSDILVPPHTLRQLLQAEREIVAACVPNDGHLDGSGRRCNFLRYHAAGGRPVHVSDYVPGDLIEVDVAGAAILINRAVVEEGARYQAGFGGEDEGFCRAARARGFRIWADTGLLCDHRMVEPPAE